MRIVRLTESDLERIVKRVITEQPSTVVRYPQDTKGLPLSMPIYDMNGKGLLQMEIDKVGMSNCCVIIQGHLRGEKRQEGNEGGNLVNLNYSCSENKYFLKLDFTEENWQKYPELLKMGKIKLEYGLIEVTIEKGLIHIMENYCDRYVLQNKKDEDKFSNYV